MVVLAASICTRGGKPLVSRQFRDISRDRITALLANFPSLISNSSSQHTSVEDDKVRYVYQPLEEFYIVLITNKTSNILQDIDTLHLFASTVSNLVRNVDEREIFENSFEIIGAFDEIINLGYKENLTLSQVQTFLEMDSHEEKIQEIIERNKELEATEERKRRAKEIQRKESAKKNMEQQFGQVGGGSMGYDSYQTQQQQQAHSYQPTYQPAAPTVEKISQNAPSLAPRPPARGGLQLGKKPGATKHMPAAAAAASAATSRAAVVAPVGHGAAEPLLATQPPVFHHNIQPSAPQIATPGSFSPSASPAPSTGAGAGGRVANNGILITINERVNAQLSRDGSIISSEVKGDLQLRINNQALSNAKILCKTGDKKHFKTHPNVDRNLFTTTSVISVKDKSKTFPANDQPLGVLRWRSVGKADNSSLIPIVITAWVNVDGNGIAHVTLEYELSSEFIDSHSTSGGAQVENVRIVVPIVSEDIQLQDGGNDQISYEVSNEGVVFQIGEISLDDPQGSFEFIIPVNEEDELFPLEVQFDIVNTGVVESDVSLGGVSIIDVVANNDDEASLPFDLHSHIISESYVVQ
ncbi:Coatomer subunit delta [Spathaspora sp. JA1]|nr:Coatomer subunit delta [Spathaspora sp. JA1]